MFPRKTFNTQDYIDGIQTNPCFICQMVAGNPQYRHHIIYEDENAIVFLNKYPTLYGYVLVAPREHKEQVTGDFSLAAYLGLQQVIYVVTEAVRKCMNPERVYILSLGSQQGNQHVHWHIAPLPAGVPFAEQQLNALRFDNGILDIPDAEMDRLTADLRTELVKLINGNG